MEDILWKGFLRRDAIRIARKNNDKFDELPEEKKEAVIEMLIEDLNDKYTEEY